MSDNATPIDPDVEPQGGAPAELDLSRYRTSGLVGNLVELISVPHALRRVFIVTLYLMIGALFAILAIFYQAELSGIGWLVVCAYSLVAGLILGIALGVLRVLSRALRSIEELLKITLNITENAATDFADLQSGSTRMPSAGELVEQVYEQVLLPTLEEAVSEAFGFIGRPILWIYRRSIGAAVSFVIKKSARFSMTQEEAAVVVDKTKEQIGVLAKYPEYVRAYTKQAAEFVHRVSSRIRFYATLPLYIAFFLCLFVACVPIVIMRFLATGEPGE